MSAAGPRLRAARERAGLTQRDLALRAGVSRQLVAAVEAGRNTPSVDAGIRLARALGTGVEELFGAPAAEPVAVPSGRLREGDAVTVVTVGGRAVARVLDPAGATAAWDPPDGVVEGGLVRLLPGADPRGLLVLGCDPALGLVEGLAERRGPQRIVGVPATTGAAVGALAEGRAHAALVHAAEGELPAPPVAVRRVHLARWRVGLAVAGAAPASLADVLAGAERIVQREASATSQRALARACERLGLALAPGPVASGHLDAAARAGATGLPALTMEPAGAARGLAFVPIETHVVECWVAERWLGHPGAAVLAELLASAALRSRLGRIAGYDLDGMGAEPAA